MKIPKRLGHIWIGPKRPPQEWMQTWIDRHPDWHYTLYGNEYLASHNFQTKPQMEEYLRRGWYAGVADLLRYEILYREGGFLAEADSLCLHPIDELLGDGKELYTVYENEFVRGKLVSPIVAAAPGHPFLKELIERLSRIPPADLDRPWKQTGNLFVAQLIEELKPDITIWPSYTLIPEHYTGLRYEGPGKIYARQMFGETNNAYEYVSIMDWLCALRQKLYALRVRKHLRKLRRQRG
ncbi:glycosyltransferase family 32 protein [Chelativorans composti]|jgi:Mannosyltransferase OCH1 and related enzymes